MSLQFICCHVFFVTSLLFLHHAFHRASADGRSAVKAAEEINQRQLYRDVAAILEVSSPADAGVLYERADMHERAAVVYIKAKNWVKVPRPWCCWWC